MLRIRVGLLVFTEDDSVDITVKVKWISTWNAVVLERKLQIQ
ncbi:MAG: hypothetical protein R3C12_24705 [Planctomycetaceae bacterium]